MPKLKNLVVVICYISKFKILAFAHTGGNCPQVTKSIPVPKRTTPSSNQNGIHFQTNPNGDSATTNPNGDSTTTPLSNPNSSYYSRFIAPYISQVNDLTKVVEPKKRRVYKKAEPKVPTVYIPHPCKWGSECRRNKETYCKYAHPEPLLTELTSPVAELASPVAELASPVAKSKEQAIKLPVKVTKCDYQIALDMAEAQLITECIGKFSKDFFELNYNLKNLCEYTFKQMIRFNSDSIIHTVGDKQYEFSRVRLFVKRQFQTMFRERLQTFLPNTRILFDVDRNMQIFSIGCSRLIFKKNRVLEKQ